MRAMTACERRVEGRGEGDDLVQPGVVEPVAQRGAGRLAGVAVPPVVGMEPPGHLDRRRARQRGVHPVQAHHAGERRPPGDLDRPQAPALAVHLLVEALDQCVALGPAGRRAERLDDQGVGVQLGEGRPVHVGERSQHQPRRHDGRPGTRRG